MEITSRQSSTHDSRQTMIWLAVLALSLVLLLWQVAAALAYVSYWPPAVVSTTDAAAGTDSTAD
jgi:hypothetical protein